MDRFGSAENLVTLSSSLPYRQGKRPRTIRGPLHVQSDDNEDDRTLRSLVKEVVTWPGIEPALLPVGSSSLVSLQVDKEVATADQSVFITEREFGRVLFGAPTIYLSLPLGCAHWAIIRGWAEPHFSSSFGLIPPGVMVIYVPRDDHEAAVCRSLIWISYNFSLSERQRNSVHWNAHWFDIRHKNYQRELVAAA